MAKINPKGTLFPKKIGSGWSRILETKFPGKADVEVNRMLNKGFDVVKQQGHKGQAFGNRQKVLRVYVREQYGREEGITGKFGIRRGR